MVDVLFCWELGAELGHLGRFAPIARELLARGHRVTLAVRDTANVARSFAGLPVRVLQAPLAHPAPPNKAPILSYSDLVVRSAFPSIPAARGAVDAWRALIELVAPDVLVVDHGPTALLAARTLGLPTTVLGTGFASPPRVDVMPPLRPWASPPPEELAERERAALVVINGVLGAHGAKPLRRVADLFDVQEDFLTTFPELDHYPGRVGQRYWGPIFTEEEGEEPRFPADRRRAFVYLRATHPHFAPVLDALGELGFGCTVFAPALDDAMRKRFASEAIHFATSPVRIASLAGACELAVCHGGFSTTSAMLLSGVPLLLVPTHTEQLMTARNVARIGCGLHLPVTPDGQADEREPPDVRGALRRLVEDPGFGARARAFASTWQHHDRRRTVDRIVDRLEAVAGQPRTAGGAVETDRFDLNEWVVIRAGAASYLGRPTLEARGIAALKSHVLSSMRHREPLALCPAFDFLAPLRESRGADGQVVMQRDPIVLPMDFALEPTTVHVLADAVMFCADLAPTDQETYRRFLSP